MRERTKVYNSGMRNDIDLDAVLYVYKRLRAGEPPITESDVAYISGRLEEFLRAHGYIHDEEMPDVEPRRSFGLDDIKKKFLGE